MTPFVPQLGAPMRAWRVDQAIYKAAWDSAIGAHGSGGRWNPKGQKALYCSLDAATAILEVAVHKGFRALDRVPHVITSFTITFELQEPLSIRGQSRQLVVDLYAFPVGRVAEPDDDAAGTPQALAAEFLDVLCMRG